MKSTSAYQAEKAILDQALASGGGTITFDTPGQAIHFRHRAYAFRKIVRDNMAPTPSPYDLIMMPPLKKGQKVVEIKPTAVKGVFTPAEGAPVTAPKFTPEVPEDDPLLAEALRLAGDLDLEIPE